MSRDVTCRTTTAYRPERRDTGQGWVDAYRPETRFIRHVANRDLGRVSLGPGPPLHDGHGLCDSAVRPMTGADRWRRSRSRDESRRARSHLSASVAPAVYRRVHRGPRPPHRRADAHLRRRRQPVRDAVSRPSLAYPERAPAHEPRAAARSGHGLLGPCLTSTTHGGRAAHLVCGPHR